MKLSHDEVRKIAKLARLGLTEDEVAKFSAQLSDILGHARMLDEVNTDGVEPTTQVTGLESVTFKDGVVKCGHAEALIKQSPQQIQNGMIKVKSVF